MKYTYSGRPIEDNIKDLPRVPTKNTLNSTIYGNWLKLFSLIAFIGALLWLVTL